MLACGSEEISRTPVVVEERLREGPILMGRDKQKRQVRGRQGMPDGVLAQLGGLGGQVPISANLNNGPKSGCQRDWTFSVEVLPGTPRFRSIPRPCVLGNTPVQWLS